MSSTRYLAVDLGAESGRVILGMLADGRLMLEEMHRFPNRVREVDGHLRWDLAHLEAEIFAGVTKAAGRGQPVDGISTDSWGVDYVRLDAKRKPLGDPFCDCDGRTDKSPASLFQKIPFAGIYAEMGIQLMPINTLFQLEAGQHDAPAALDGADHFLTIADYCNARFSDIDVIEKSQASTTQLYNPSLDGWSKKLAAALGLSPQLFPKIVPSGTVLGPVVDPLKAEPGLANAQVVATCSHDTGAAVAAIPAMAGSWAYLSSGTWSLLGVELDAPIITESARAAGFNNEIGLRDTVRFLKNIAGLWVLQECRRAWKEESRSFNYEELINPEEAQGPARAHLALSDPRFVSAGEMPAKISAFCTETNQPVPSTVGQFVRIILESLALTYAQALRQLEDLIGRKFERLHIVGGGSCSRLLNQLTTDAIGLPVMAGPVEATAIGNILIQAQTLGHLEIGRSLRQTVENSFPTQTFVPTASLSDEARTRFQKLPLRHFS